MKKGACDAPFFVPDFLACRQMTPDAAPGKLALAAPRDDPSDHPPHHKVKDQTKQAHNQDRHPDQFIIRYGARHILDEANTGCTCKHLGSDQSAPANTD